MVWVVPGKFPAKVIVAPNSPSALAHARTQARGTPKKIDSPVDRNEHGSDSRRAVTVVDSETTPHASLQGARHKSPMNGSAKKATAMNATPATGKGRPARALPERRAAP